MYFILMKSSNLKGIKAPYVILLEIDGFLEKKGGQGYIAKLCITWFILPILTSTVITGKSGMSQLTLCICLLLSVIYLASPVAIAITQQEAATTGDTEQEPSAADQEAPAKAYLIVVKGDVNSWLAGRVRRGLENAAAGGAQVVIVEIDTFGGRIDAAVEIRDALLNVDLRTIAFVNKRAISAGALIALAADEIVMTPGATIGAATPMRFTSEGPKPLGEKTISYFRKEMKATAESQGHPTALAEAMVDLDVVIPGVIETGKLLTLTTQEALALKLAAAQSDDLRHLLQAYKLELVTGDQYTQAWDVESWFKQFSTWQVWLILGFVLIVGEMFVSGFFLLWFAVASLMASLLAWLQVPMAVQIGTFLVSSFLLLVFSRTVLQSTLFRSQANIATNVEALKGRSGIVMTTIEGSHKSGSVKIGGEVWSAFCADDIEISEGSKVEVLEIVGNKAEVKPL